MFKIYFIKKKLRFNEIRNVIKIIFIIIKGHWGLGPQTEHEG